MKRFRYVFSYERALERMLCQNATISVYMAIIFMDAKSKNPNFIVPIGEESGFVVYFE